MNYALEAKNEFERLNEQSEFQKYDYKKELKGIELKDNSKVLDAGCGSGIVSRYLESKGHFVSGVDLSAERIEQCKQFSRDSQVEYSCQNLSALNLKDNAFDAVICRYVFQHVSIDEREKVIAEFHRVLKPGGQLYIIDFDGAYHNVFPREGIIDEVLSKIESENKVDLFIGRKLPWYMKKASFSNIGHQIETIDCQGEVLDEEKYLIRERFENALPFFSQVAGSKEKARDFVEAYIENMDREDIIYFSNKFLVKGTKKANLKLVK